MNSIKVKVKVNITPDKTTKTQRGVYEQLYSFFNYGVKGEEWSVPHPGGFTTREWTVTRSAGLDRRGKSRPQMGYDPRTVKPVASSYTGLWLSKYKLFIIQSTVNNSHYHPNTHQNILLP